MKKGYQIVAGLLVVISLSAFVVTKKVWVNDQDKNKVILSMAMGYLENVHYQKPTINDDFSKNAFDQYIKRMDYNKRFYLQSDIKELDAYRERIDDEIKEETFNFYSLANQKLDERRSQVKSFYAELLEKPYDFSKEEQIEMDHEKREFAKSLSELKKIWHKDLKYQTLSRLHRKIEKQEKLLANSDTVIEVKSIEALEQEAREGVKENMDNYFIRAEKINEKDRISLYVNSILSISGPHTSYFPPEDKENFDISMSGKLEGIGARLSQPGNEIKVVSIVPGSASALQGDLKVDDIITAVAQGNDDFVNVEEMRLDDAIKLIRGSKGTTVRLAVTHKNGAEEIIPIVRDVVIIEETYAKSFILENEDKRVGYIKLPKFYTDFNNQNGRTCSKDVELELEKLKDQKVEGVILDLRNNGGGSLRDVVDMVGLFIDQGPVVQVRDKENELQVLEDKRAGTVYDGPLVVMVNEYSASASEILAAAIQDYGRGIIIGNTTFGKGTVQRFWDMDRMLSGQMSAYKPLGAIKITMQKFYRINGGSTQLKGVTPDITLPDLYSYIETGEREQDFVMPWDKINPAQYTPVAATYNKIELQAKMKAVLKGSEFFKTIDEMAIELEKNQDQTDIELQLEKFKAHQAELKQESDDYDALFEAIEGFEVFALPSDLKAMGTDSIKVKINEEQIESLQEDQYVFQSAQLVERMLKSKPSTFKSTVKYESR